MGTILMLAAFGGFFIGLIGGIKVIFKKMGLLGLIVVITGMLSACNSHNTNNSPELDKITFETKLSKLEKSILDNSGMLAYMNDTYPFELRVIDVELQDLDEVDQEPYLILEVAGKDENHSFTIGCGLVGDKAEDMKCGKNAMNDGYIRHLLSAGVGTEIKPFIEESFKDSKAQIRWAVSADNWDEDWYKRTKGKKYEYEKFKKETPLYLHLELKNTTLKEQEQNIISLLDNLEAIDAIELYFVEKKPTVLSIEKNEYDTIKSTSDLKKYEGSPFSTDQFEIEYERFNGTLIKGGK